MQAPHINHWNVVLRILRYIKKVLRQGLLYEDNGDSRISRYCDADWVGCPIDRCSTTGYCVFLGGNLISWKSKKQNVVAQYNAEVEYRAMALITCEFVWIKQLIRELKFCEDHPMRLHCDNQVALNIASNLVFHERTKHIEVECHFVREKLLFKEISTEFVNSSEQLADVMTKSLRRPLIQFLCSKLSAYNLYAPA
uniref:Copia protein n=1 Tax=Cajanus cajan TaxID=3821 RepID=A0A151S749_CAJCA|nr:Copia protein [Cajanus cajan]